MLAQSTTINRRYRIIRKLGEGGMGVVYLAEDCIRQQNVALKTLKQGLTANESSRFLEHEFKALIQLQHPNLTRVYDFGLVESTREIFFTMEYLVGSNLFDATAGMADMTMLELIVQICRALEYIHARGIVHCDIKPENVMVIPAAGPPGLRVKLMDFGLAKPEFFPASGVIRGTPDYIAPEFLCGTSIDHRADLYSLGIVLYKLVRRKLPMEDTQATARQRYLAASIARPPQLDDKPIREPFKTLIRRLACPDPGERFFRANEVIRAIGELTGVDFHLDTRETLEGYILSAGFIERHDERQVLTAALEKLQKPQPLPIIFICGETGTGKTRLAREFRIQCQLAGHTFISAAYHENRSRSYGPLPFILREVLALLPPECSLIKTYRRSLAHFLPELGPTGEQTSHDLSPEQGKWQLIHAVTTFLITAAQENSFVLHFEDIHFGTRDDHEFLEYFWQTLTAGSAQQARPQLLLLVSLRPEEMPADSNLPSLIEELVARQQAQRIVLQGFDTSQTALFIKAMLSIDPPPVELARHIIQETDGNPYFIEEVIKSLIEEGAIARNTSCWRSTLESTAEIEIPDNITKVVQRRLAQLPPDAINILEFMAVYAHPVPVSILLEKVLAPFIPLLGELLRRGILEMGQGPQGLTYGFHHGSLRKLLYQQMPPERRRLLHLQIGNLLEKYYGELPEVLEDLAYHFIAAQEAAQIRTYALKAARQCVRCYAPQQALQYFIAVRQVLDLSTPCDRTLFWQIQEEMAELYCWLGDPASCLELLQQISPAEKEAQSLSRIYRKIGVTYILLSQYEEAIAYFKQAVRLYPDPYSVEVACNYNNLGRVYELMGEFQQGKHYVMQALAILEKQQPQRHRELANAYTILGNLCLGAADYDSAHSFYQASFNICQRIDYAPGLASAYNNLALVAHEQGHWDQALADYRRALRTWEELRHPSGIALTQGNLGALYADQGKYEQSIRASQQSLDLFEKSGDLAGLARAHECLGVAHSQAGRWRESFQHHQYCLRLCQQSANQQLAAYSLLNLAHLHMLFNALDSAAQMANQALGIARSSGARLLEGSALGISARVMVRQKQVGEALERLEQARRLFSELELQHEQSKILQGLAEAWGARANPQQACQLATQGLQIAQQFDNQPLQMELLVLLAQQALQMEDVSAVFQHLRQAQNLARPHQRLDLLWQIHYLRARAYMLQQRYWPARTEYLAAVDKGQKLMQQLPSPLQQSYLLDPRHHALSQDVQQLKTILDQLA